MSYWFWAFVQRITFFAGENLENDCTEAGYTENDYTFDPHSSDWFDSGYETQFVSDKIGFKVEIADRLHNEEIDNICVTTDGGKTFEKRSVFPNEEKYQEGWILDVKFINEKVGFLSKRSGYIFKTTDGGYTWICINKDLPSYKCPDGYISGSSDIIIDGENIQIYQKIYSKEGYGEGFYGPSRWFATSKWEYDSDELGVKYHAIFTSTNLGESWKFTGIKKLSEYWWIKILLF